MAVFWELRRPAGYAAIGGAAIGAAIGSAVGAAAGAHVINDGSGSFLVTIPVIEIITAVVIERKTQKP